MTTYKLASEYYRASVMLLSFMTPHLSKLGKVERKELKVLQANFRKSRADFANSLYGPILPFDTAEQAQEPDREVRTIRNGHQVAKDTTVWWRAADGPQQVTGNDGSHWENMRQFPDLYQLTEPKWTYLYED